MLELIKIKKKYGNIFYIWKQYVKDSNFFLLLKGNSLVS